GRGRGRSAGILSWRVVGLGNHRRIRSQAYATGSSELEAIYYGVRRLHRVHSEIHGRERYLRSRSKRAYRRMNQWAEIPGFGGRYRITSDGRIQTNSRGEWRDMSKPLDRHGYELIYLWDSDKQSKVRRLVHQLVAEIFVPKPEGATCVNHLDGDKRNNRHSNLEWTTLAGNM